MSLGAVAYCRIAAGPKQFPAVFPEMRNTVRRVAHRVTQARTAGQRPLVVASNSNTQDMRRTRDGHVVADMIRLEKEHTEGLETNVTEEIVKLMPVRTGRMTSPRRR